MDSKLKESLRMPLKSHKCKWEKANAKLPQKDSMDYKTQKFVYASKIWQMQMRNGKRKITNKIEINEITPKTWINSNTIYNEFF